MKPNTQIPPDNAKWFRDGLQRYLEEDNEVFIILEVWAGSSYYSPCSRCRYDYSDVPLFTMFRLKPKENGENQEVT